MRAIKRSKNTGNCPAGQKTNAHNQTMDCRARYCAKNEYQDKTVCKPVGALVLPALLRGWNEEIIAYRTWQPAFKNS